VARRTAAPIDGRCRSILTGPAAHPHGRWRGPGRCVRAARAGSLTHAKSLGAPLRRRRTGSRPARRRPPTPGRRPPPGKAGAAAAAGDETERTRLAREAADRHWPRPRRPHRRVAGARRRPRTVPRAPR
jgi:hypothetical protein